MVTYFHSLSESTIMNNKTLQNLLSGRVSIKDRALFYEHMSNLVDGWVTILEALRSFIEKTHNFRLKTELDNLLFFLESGDKISIAMRKIPGFFSEREIALIEAGEESGTIQKSFITLANSMREQDELRSKVVWALIYPLVIVFFLFLAIGVVMIYVIPKITPILIESGGELPFATKALIMSSDFISNNYIVLLALLAVGFFSWKSYITFPTGRLAWDRWKLRSPLMWEVYRNYLLAQIASTLGLLLDSGITIMKALRLAAKSSSNAFVDNIFEGIIYNIAHGKKLGESMREFDPGYELFTPEFIQLIEVSEKTSTVNKVCFKLTEQYRRAIDYALGIMIKFIEPIAILVSGIFVLWFALAIFSAIMGVVQWVGI